MVPTTPPGPNDDTPNDIPHEIDQQDETTEVATEDDLEITEAITNITEGQKTQADLFSHTNENLYVVNEERMQEVQNDLQLIKARNMRFKQENIRRKIDNEDPSLQSMREKIEDLAFDPATGLLNRAQLTEIDHLIATEKEVSVGSFDLDFFKAFNETFGTKEYGDFAIQLLAKNIHGILNFMVCF